ncbi:hypothetical protein Tco_1532462 [Tanacetum coccineum]
MGKGGRKCDGKGGSFMEVIRGRGRGYVEREEKGEGGSGGGRGGVEEGEGGEERMEGSRKVAERVLALPIYTSTSLSIITTSSIPLHHYLYHHHHPLALLMLRGLWDPELLGLDREMHYLFMRLRCPRCGYRFVRGCVVLLLVQMPDGRGEFCSWMLLGKLSSTIDQEDEIIYSQLDDARYDELYLELESTGWTVIGPSTGALPSEIEVGGPDYRVPLGHGRWMPVIRSIIYFQCLILITYHMIFHMALVTEVRTVMAQQSEIVELRAADQRRQDSGFQEQLKQTIGGEE